jgi:DNA-binding SARP family transcriptional activator
VEFRLLGPVHVDCGGIEVRLGGRRQQAVLAALLLRVNRVSTMAYLAEATWARPIAAPESNIRTYIAGLRRILRTYDPGPDRIAARPGGYLFHALGRELDVHQFAECVTYGDAELDAAAPLSAVRSFKRALELWRGRPLEGLELGASLRSEVVRLEELRVHAIRRQAAAEALLGQHTAAVRILRGLAAERPLDEGVWADLMSTLAAAGRQAEVLAAYTEIRRHLVDELGIEPGSQLQSQHRRVLAGERGVHR